MSLFPIEEVEPLLRRSLAIRERALPSDDPQLALSLTLLSGTLREVGRLPEAEELEARSNEILRLCREHKRTDCDD